MEFSEVAAAVASARSVMDEWLERLRGFESDVRRREMKLEDEQRRLDREKSALEQERCVRA